MFAHLNLAAFHFMLKLPISFLRFMTVGRMNYLKKLFNFLKRNQNEEDEVDMTGDIVMKVLKISGSRCAHSNSARPGPNR